MWQDPDFDFESMCGAEDKNKLVTFHSEELPGDWKNTERLLDGSHFKRHQQKELSKAPMMPLRHPNRREHVFVCYDKFGRTPLSALMD